MTLKEFESKLVGVIIDAVSGGYFRDPAEDDEGLNHDELQGLIEEQCDELDFDVYEHGTSYRDLADKYEGLIIPDSWSFE